MIDLFDILWEFLDIELVTWFLGWTGVFTAKVLSLGRAQWSREEVRSIVLGLAVAIGGVSAITAWVMGGETS